MFVRIRLLLSVNLSPQKATTRFMAPMLMLRFEPSTLDGLAFFHWKSKRSPMVSGVPSCLEIFSSTCEVMLSAAA